MAKSIEIYENTLLKLIVRQGPDSQRKQIVLSVGELGYSTDTKRLYIGDGSTYGGVPAGNVFRGEQTTLANIATAYQASEVGDLAFATNEGYLYKLTALPGSISGNWTVIGGVYTAGDGSILISNTSVRVGQISADNIHPSAAAAPIYINPSNSNKLSLSSTIPVNVITAAGAADLTLPTNLRINGSVYTFPSTTLVNNTFARIQADGTLNWTKLSAVDISTNTITVTNGLTATGNGINITGVATNPLTSTIVLGLDTSILSTINAATTIFETTSGLLWSEKWGVLNIQDVGPFTTPLSTFTSNTTALTATRLSRGTFRFSYPATNLQMPFVTADTISDRLGWFAKVTEATSAYCVVEVFSLANLLARYDLPVTVLIKDTI
jgi:hypothetical protein